MISIEIHDNENVSIITNEEEIYSYLDNKCNVKTKFKREDGVLLLGKISVLQDIASFFDEGNK